MAGANCLRRAGAGCTRTRTGRLESNSTHEAGFPARVVSVSHLGDIMTALDTPIGSQVFQWGKYVDNPRSAK